MNYLKGEDTGFSIIAVIAILVMLCTVMCCNTERRICPVPIGKYVSDCVNDRIQRAHGAFSTMPSGTIGEIRDSCKADAECVCDESGVCPHYKGFACSPDEMDKYFPRRMRGESQ